MQALNSSAGQMAISRFGKGGFWEHTIRDSGDFARHVDYVYFNPVKHGLVRRVRDWQYSSFHRHVREGLLPDDWAGDTSRNDGDFGEPGGGDEIP